MSVQMSNKSKPNNSMNEARASSESPSPGRCPIGEQDGPGHHWITADRRTTRRMVPRREKSCNAMLQQKWVWEKWIQEENAWHMKWNGNV